MPYPSRVVGLRLRVLSGAVVCACAAAGASGQVIADSVNEFSGEQGLSGWHYGFYDAANDADAIYSPLLDFQEFSPSEFTGSLWRAGGASTMLTLVGGAPSGTDAAAGEQWAVRRWLSEFSGLVRIEGVFGELDTRGAGTIGRVLVNGREVLSEQASGSPRAYMVETRVRLGASVDFAIDPAGDGRFDLAQFTAVITLIACSADLDANGVIDVFDLLSFLNAWFVGNADFNVDGATTPLDLIEFVNAWFDGDEGCPL